MKHGVAYRVFRKDVGRKITALLMALLVFAAFEKQTQNTFHVTVRIEYVDDGEFQRDEDWVLYVVQRSDPSRPLAVPRTDARPRSLELELSGTKETVSSLIDAPQRFKFDPTEAEDYELSLDDLTGIEDIRSSVRSLRLLQPVTLSIVVEEQRTIQLGRQHLRLVGTPMEGVRSPDIGDEDALQFHPPEITLVGASELLGQVLDTTNPLALFSIDVQSLSGTRDFRLQLRPGLEEQLKILEGDLRVDVTFPLDMEVAGDPISKTVQLVRDPLALEQRQDIQDRLNAGERLELADGETGARLIQILRPSRSTAGEYWNQAREEVQLFTLWHHLDPELLEIPVILTRMRGFPANWDADLVEGEARKLKVQWVKDGDEEPASTESGDER